ncbi:DUF3570 domain-containing protein [uncultured Shewanella sp.]|uniref:DUF3570 domain-containing protein n=1 Tax=uncultured Shewanella sp. TaxID=173975 RepID=UPI00261A101F|nr:DUF3570 domain-containing protein [uncultured Shewanella sp.]
MQLKNRPNISKALALASCSLLGHSVQAAASEDKADDWKVDAAIMYYGEQERVRAIEAIGNVQKAFGDESLLDVKLVVDSLTGASASGAVAQNEGQTFTRPSGDGEYQTPAGETPLDDTFHDTRAQISANWSEIHSPVLKTDLGLNLSKEFDYFSLGLNGGVERSFNKDNTTLALSGAYTLDNVDPVGGRPVGLSAMALREDYDSEQEFRSAFERTRMAGTDEKQTLDLMLSITQVLSRRWLLQANYGLSDVSGYMTDPYKLLSEVDNTGTTQRYLYEKRPDSRLKHSFYMMTKGALESGVVDFSYRYSTDDWDLNSHTLETHYRYYFGGRFYGQLHLRYYRQQAANFYRPFISVDEPVPDYASADYRIGEMTSYTLGLKLGQRLSDGHELSYRLEYYQQNPENSGFELVGQLKEHELFPEVKAVIAQVSYSF